MGNGVSLSFLCLSIMDVVNLLIMFYNSSRC